MTELTTCPRCAVQFKTVNGACCEWHGSTFIMCSTCACFTHHINYWMSEIEESPSTSTQKETNTEMTHCTNCGKTIDSANTTCFACSPFAECEFTLAENDEIVVTESAVIGNDDPEMTESCPMCAAHPGKLCKLCAARKRVTSTQKRPSRTSIYNMLLVESSSYANFHGRLQLKASELFKTQKARLRLINDIAALLDEDRGKWYKEGMKRFEEYYGISGNHVQAREQAMNDIDYLIEMTVANFPVLTEAFFAGVDRACVELEEVLPEKIAEDVITAASDIHEAQTRIKDEIIACYGEYRHDIAFQINRIIADRREVWYSLGITHFNRGYDLTHDRYKACQYAEEAYEEHYARRPKGVPRMWYLAYFAGVAVAQCRQMKVDTAKES